MKHILIDYENIQPKSFDGIETKDCHVWLFLGVNQQKSLPLELVETLLEFDNESVHIIRMQHAGKNALDFYLSFYLGKISEIDPKADVYILARDSGYDILVEHLNSAYDGINIVRLASANQLTVADESNGKNASDVEKSQFIVEDNQGVLCDHINNVIIENQKSLTQTIEDNVPKAVIHECYVLVFDSIVNRRVFLPSYKSNLLYSMKKYVPVTVLESFNSIEQDYIFEKVFEKFIKAGLISIDEKEEKLSYKVDSQGMLDLVKDQVVLNRAKKIDGLNNVIKQKLASYRQVNNEKQVSLVVTWLEKQGFIKQHNQVIYYPSFDDATVSSSKTPATLYQRAIALIKNRPVGTRPSKKSSLTNYLKSHLRNEDPKTIDKLVKQMVSNKIIVISNTNKLIYKI